MLSCFLLSFVLFIIDKQSFCRTEIRIFHPTTEKIEIKKWIHHKLFIHRPSHTSIEFFVSEIIFVLVGSELKIYIFQEHFFYLADLKAKDFLKVCRLADEQQIKGPASAEIGHNDCIDRHGGEELPPGGLKFLHNYRNKNESAECEASSAASLSKTGHSLPWHPSVWRFHRCSPRCNGALLQ